MLDNANVEAFYREYFKPFKSSHVFGLTSNQLDQAGRKWVFARRHTASDHDAGVAAVSDNIGRSNPREVHLAVGLIPADAVTEDGSFKLPKKATGLVSRAFVLDLDVHHNPDKKRKASDYADGAECVQSFVDAVKAGLPLPDFIVRSGSGGLHLWYFITNYITDVTHSTMLRSMQEQCSELGLKFDKQAGFCKNNVRAPGSPNLKPHLGGAWSTCEPGWKKGTRSARALQKAFNINVEVRSGHAEEHEQSHKDANTFDEYETYTSADVKAACPFLVHQFATGSTDLDRQQWLGVASVVRHIDKWPESWGNQCKKLYGDVTDADLESALDPDIGLAGPIACEDMGGGVGLHPACKGCQVHTLARGGGYPINWIQHHYKRRIAGVSEKPAKPPKAAEVVGDSAPDTIDDSDAPSGDVPGFDELRGEDFMPMYINGKPTLFASKTKRGKKVPDMLVCTPIFSVMRVESRERGSLVIVEVDGQEKSIRMSSVNNKSAACKELGDVGVTVEHETRAHAYINRMATLAPRVVMGKQAGWSTHHNRFNTLESLLRPAHSAVTARLEDPPLGGATMGVRGSTEGWKDALAPLVQYKAEPFQFAVMLGFASPLLTLLEKESRAALVSFYHPDSGQGKTTCLQLANSVFMRPVETNIGFDDTDSSAFRQMGTLKHLMCSIDEMTSKISDNFFNPIQFVNMVASGHERGRLSAGGGAQQRTSWQLITAISANASINNAILTKSNPEGALARVQEIFFDNAPLLRADADMMMDDLQENHGVAGPEFIGRLLDMDNMHRDVNKKFIDKRDQLVAASGAVSNSHRFALNLFALVLAALHFTNKWGITEFTESLLMDWCVMLLTQRSDAMRTQQRQVEVTPTEFFTQCRTDIYNEEGYRLFTPEGVTRETSHPIFYVDGRIFVSNTTFTHWCRSNRYPTTLLQRWQHDGFMSQDTVVKTFMVNGAPVGRTHYFKINLDTFMDETQLNAIRAASTEASV